MSCRSSFSFIPVLTGAPGAALRVRTAIIRRYGSRNTGGSRMLFGDEHVRRYEATDGAEGHEWQGAATLILTTTRRKSGQEGPNALNYQNVGDGYLIVASKGG